MISNGDMKWVSGTTVPGLSITCKQPEAGEGWGRGYTPKLSKMLRARAN